MRFKKPVFDRNDCRFTGKLLTNPVLSECETKKGFVNQCDFRLAICSNSKSGNVSAIADCVAYGDQAIRIAAKMGKGYGVLVDAEFSTYDGDFRFIVHDIFLVSIPDALEMESALIDDGND